MSSLPSVSQGAPSEAHLPSQLSSTAAQTIAVSNHGNHRKTNDLLNVNILGLILGSYCKYDIDANVISKPTSRCLRMFIGFDKKSNIVTCCCLSILEIILMKKKAEKK